MQPVATELTPLERRILDFERTWWRQPGAKAQAIVQQFEISQTLYYQHLAHALRNPAAMVDHADVVYRLTRAMTATLRYRLVHGTRRAVA